MNREILFRGVALDTDKWIIGYGVIVMPETKTSFIIHKQGNNLHQHTEVIPETVGQFTGLMDKNGTKIFEGDILSCINPNDGEIYTTGFIASLINGITFTNTKLIRELAMYECEWPDELQITGNIHDNSTP